MTQTAKKRVGRTSALLDEQRREQILIAVRAGSPVEICAAAGGVSASTLREWLRRGEGRDVRQQAPEHVAFAAAYREAHTTFVLDCLRSVQQAHHGFAETVTTTTEKLDQQGSVIERTVVTKQGIKRYPWAATWLLEHLRPDLFAVMEHRLTAATAEAEGEATVLDETEAARAAIARMDDELEARRAARANGA